MAWASPFGQAWMFTWTLNPGKLFPWRQRRTLLGQRWNISSPSRILICLQMKNIIFVSNSGKHAGDLTPALNSSFINLKTVWRYLNLVLFHDCRICYKHFIDSSGSSQELGQYDCTHTPTRIKVITEKAHTFLEALVSFESIYQSNISVLYKRFSYVL